VASVMHKVSWALECQLERDSDLSFVEYHALARLSEERDRSLRMSELAVLTNSSLSRLSHLVTRLEKWGLVRRERGRSDGRFTIATLTKAGYAKLVASAPAHVAAVRQLVIDEFSPTELDQLREYLSLGSTPLRGRSRSSDIGSSREFVEHRAGLTKVPAPAA